MKQNSKIALSAIVFSGAIGLTVGPTWAQDKPTTPSPGADRPGAAQQKEGPSAKPGTAQQKEDPSAKPGAKMGSEAGRAGSEPGKMGAEEKTAAPGRAGAQKYSQETIKEVQQALKGKGHDPGAIDGIMGQQTSQALRDFQKKNNVKATGALDEETAQKLGVSLNGGAKAAGKPEGMAGEKGTEGKAPARKGAAGESATEQKK
jgi:peptidoglycan hydrolase-like protein with peptidoglycan-binding domain